MTVSSLTPVNNYTGNGSVTTFDFDFFIENQNELVVTHINTNGISNVLEYGIDYSINEIGNENGSYINFPISGSKYGNLASGEILSLSLTLPIKQESKFANSSSLNLVVLEKTFDYLVRILQILNRKIERSIKVQEGSSETPDFLIKQLEDAQRTTSMYSSKCETLTKDAGTYSENAELQATLAQKSAQEAIEVKNELIQGNMFKYQLFDIVQKDSLLPYEKSQGFELLGSYVYKNAVAGSRYGYPDFYSKCLEEKETGAVTQVTLGESIVTMYVHSNGHQYYNIDDKSAVDDFYNSTGVAWFYGIDTENERVVLPRNDYLNKYIVEGEYPVVGNGNALGYTTGTDILYGRDQHGGSSTGLVAQLVYPANNSDTAVAGTDAPNNAGTGGTGKYIGVTTDESKSGLIAQVKNSSNEFYAYMVVGNTTSDTSWIDVVTQVQGGAKDLEDKTAELIAEVETIGLGGRAKSDLSNVEIVEQAFKDMSISWNMPDMSNGISIANGSSAAPSKFPYPVMLFSTQANWGADSFLYISKEPNSTDYVSLSIGYANNAQRQSFSWLIGANHNFYITNASANTAYPLLGGNY